MNLARNRIVILVLLIGACLSFLLLSQLARHLVDAEGALEPLRQKVKQLTGQPLVTERVEVGMLTGPRIIIHGVAIRNLIEAQQPYLFYAEKMVIEIDAFDFMGAAPPVESLTLEGAQLYLERTKSGLTNWHFLKEMKEKVSAFHALDIHLKDSQLKIVDRQSDYQLTASSLNGSIALSRSLIEANLQGRMMDLPVSLEGDCSITEFVHLNSFDVTCDSALRGQNMQISASQRLLMQEAVQMRGEVSIKAKDARLWGDAFFYERKKMLQSYFSEAVQIEADIENYSDATQAIYNINSIRFGRSNGKGSLTIKKDDNRPTAAIRGFFGRLDFDEFKRLAHSASGSTRDVLAMENGYDRRWSGDMLFQAQQVSYNGIQAADVQVQGRFGGGDAIIEEARGRLPGEANFISLGRLTGTPQGVQFEGVVELGGQQLYALAPMLDIPQSQAVKEVFGRYRARLNASVNPLSTILSEIRVIAGDDVRISGGVNIGGDGAIASTLTIQNLDIGPFETQWLRQASLLEPPAPSAGLTDNPFAFSWLKEVSRPLQLDLTLTDYRFMGFDGPRGQLLAGIDKGRLTLDNLNLDLGVSQVGGSVIVERTEQQARPRVVSTLSVSRLMAGNAIRKALWDEGETRAAQVDASIWAKQALNFNPLKHFDGHHEITIGTLEHDTFEASYVDLVADVEDSVLDVSRLSMTIWGGGFNSKLRIDARALPSFSMEMEMNGTNIRRFFNSWVDYQNITGAAAVSGKILTNGVNFSSWIKNMTGAFKFEARNVVVQYFNLPAIVRAVNSVRSVTTLANAIRLAFDSGSTRFGSVDGVFYLRDGRLNITEFNLRANESIGTMEGFLDFTDWRSQMELQLGLVSLAQTNYPNLTMLFTGPMEMPQRELNLKSLESFIAQKIR